MRRLPFAVLALMVLVAPAARAAYRAEAIGITFPDRLGEFAYQEVHQYPTPGAGISVYYRHGDAAIDVYVYNADQPAIPDGPDSAQVEGQFAGSQDAALQTLRRNHGRVDILQDNTVIRPGGASGVAFRATLFRFQDAGRDHHSLLLVTGYHGNFVKLRATFPVGGRDDEAPAVNAFLAALANLLSAAPPK